MSIKKYREKQVIETANTRYIIHVSAYNTDGTVSLFEATFKHIGKSTSLHYHKKLTETFTIVNGSFMFSINNREYQLAANDSVVVRPMEIHGFRALIPDSTMLITFSNSPNRDDFFIELADRVNKKKPLNKEFYARFDQYYPDTDTPCVKD